MSQNRTENLNLVIFFKMFEIKKSELLILNLFWTFCFKFDMECKQDRC